MRVLFVSPVVPWPPESGGRMRTFNLLRALRGKAEVHLRAVLEPGQSPAAVAPLAPHCSSVRAFERARPTPVQRWTRARIERWFHSPTMTAELERELGAASFDLVHLDELLLVRAMPTAPATPVIVHHHKIDTVLHELLPGRSPLHKRFDVWKLHRLEAEAARRYRDHVVTSADDARILARRYPELSIGVVESGFDPDYFKASKPPPPRDPKRVVFVGSLSYAPNVDAVAWFVREVLPLIHERVGDLTLQVVGADPPRDILALASARVHVQGLVEDVRPYLERCAALVVPVRIGGGTRLKLVEALAMGCPVVSTRAGAQGLELVDGEHLAIADRPREFAERVLELLADPIEARRRANRAREHALARYCWPDLADRLIEIWRGAGRATPIDRSPLVPDVS